MPENLSYLKSDVKQNRVRQIHFLSVSEILQIPIPRKMVLSYFDKLISEIPMRFWFRDDRLRFEIWKKEKKRKKEYIIYYKDDKNIPL